MFTLRGIKESPPYLHDGRLLTLEDTVEFFNLILELKLTKEEKADLVAFRRQLYGSDGKGLRFAPAGSMRARNGVAH
jgi:cytochrome c peroxidase